MFLLIDTFNDVIISEKTKKSIDLNKYIENVQRLFANMF